MFSNILDNFDKRLPIRYRNYALPLLAWVVVATLPLVAFDDDGGKTAGGILRYILFGGIDRSYWWVVSPVSLIASCAAVLALFGGLAANMAGYALRDTRTSIASACVVLASLILTLLTVKPVGFLVFGLFALPHVGWWLLLAYAATTILDSDARGWIGSKLADARRIASRLKANGAF